MKLIVILLGLLLGLLGLAGLAAPSPLIQRVSSVWSAPRGLYLAVTLRLFFAAVLLGAAPQSRFPFALQGIGILSLISALVLPLIGLRRMQELLRWWTSRSDNVIRLWAMLALLFGLFLIFACL